MCYRLWLLVGCILVTRYSGCKATDNDLKMLRSNNLENINGEITKIELHLLVPQAISTLSFVKPPGYGMNFRLRSSHLCVFFFFFFGGGGGGRGGGVHDPY